MTRLCPRFSNILFLILRPLLQLLMEPSFKYYFNRYSFYYFISSRITLDILKRT